MGSIVKHTHNGYEEFHGIESDDELRRLHSEHARLNRKSKKKR